MKKKVYVIPLNTVFLFFCLVVIQPGISGNSAYAQTDQTIRVTGKVIDSSTGESIPGANIVLEGTTIGSISDINGEYSIEVPSANSVLLFSSIGYLTDKVEVNGRQQIDVELIVDITELSDVVVIGYGTQKKGDITSAVASVKSKDFIKGSVTDVGQLVQGKVAGLSVVSPTGDPTGKTQILLRGNTSLMGNVQDPLVLIDGIPGDMNTVLPEDIESIDVLKDGSAAAIYGTRGTNGVVFITTKRASGNYKSTVEYSTYMSTQTIARKLNISTADDFRQQIKDGYRTNEMEDYGQSTDWLKEITRTPLTQSHNLTFRGGDVKANYLVSLNYKDAEGIFDKSYNKTFTGRADFNQSLFDNKVKININILSSTTKQNGFNQDVYRQAIQQNPTAPVKNADGTWFEELTKFEYQNPVSELYENDGYGSDLNARYNASITYMPFSDFKMRAVFSYVRRRGESFYSETKQNASTLRDGRNGYARLGNDESIDRLAEYTAEYSRSILDHNFKILGGYSYEDKEENSSNMENWDFPTDKFSYNNIGLGEAIGSGEHEGLIGSGRSVSNLIGFFGRLTYNYKEKYLFLASIRTEEASQLWGTNNTWGSFPAVSVGWRVTKEAFMEGQSLFNDIKLRAGYGVTGSQPSDLFKAVGIIGYDIEGQYQNVYSNGKWIKTLQSTQNANPNLKWEEKRETDIGLDFSMLDNRISGSFDYYNRQIHNLLLLYPVPKPPKPYDKTLANVGVMENKGVEVMLNFIPIKTKDFQWNTSVSYSTNTNKLVSISNDEYKLSYDYLKVGAIFPPIQTFSHLIKVGGPVGDFYGYKVIDIGNDPTDEENYGQWVYEGADGNPVKYSDFGHSFEDKKVLGNGLPEFYMGWTNSFQYKNFDLSITQRGAFGFQVANLQRMMLESPTYNQYNRLTAAYDKVFGKTQIKSPLEFNSYYVEDGDYWKIDNITLGYNINETGLRYLKTVRVYASVLNAFIITKYKGIDPEVSLRNDESVAQSGVDQTPTSGLDPGVDSPWKYPTTRTYTIGLNVTF